MGGLKRVTEERDGLASEIFNARANAEEAMAALERSHDETRRSLGEEAAALARERDELEGERDRLASEFSGARAKLEDARVDLERVSNEARSHEKRIRSLGEEAGGLAKKRDELAGERAVSPRSFTASRSSTETPRSHSI